ncbi:hypothetical protein ACWKSP_19000 [Micromonosporaceae bacterium Da 78-11]
MAGSAREEAERLVAALLAMAGGSQSPDPDPDQGSAPGRTAAPDQDQFSGTRERVTAGLGALGDSVAGIVTQLTDSSAGHRSGSGWSTGSAECCVCPVCRAIASARNPGPEATERVATGAGDIAIGVASLMRGFSAMARSRPAPRPQAARPADRAAARSKPGNPDETWSVATRRDETRNDAGGAWSAATNAGANVPAGDPDDPWSAATATSAAAVEAERVAARAAEQRAAAKAAAARAAEAARRVEEAVALANAARAAAAANEAATAAEAEVTAGTGGKSADPSATPDLSATADRAAAGDRGVPQVPRRTVEQGAAGTGGGAVDPRTARRFDVWAAATADEGVADVTRPVTVDHDGPGASAPEDRGAAVGDDARDGDAV